MNKCLLFIATLQILHLASINNATSKVEWILSVSMFNEGWDVKRVFQIVPHEKRALRKIAYCSSTWTWFTLYQMIGGSKPVVQFSTMINGQIYPTPRL